MPNVSSMTVCCAMQTLGRKLTPVLGACPASCILGAQDAGHRAGRIRDYQGITQSGDLGSLVLAQANRQ
eukprot:1525026-Ditylum_brightwellii.AAC.1